jgi:carboxypeptidase Taq
MEEYLGVRPKDDGQGVLQDIHWSDGYVGYFATYSLGNVIGGMIYEKIRKDLNLEDLVARGELEPIKQWLREHVHKWGATYSPKELQQKLFGQAYNPKPLLQYLEQKYLS